MDWNKLQWKITYELIEEIENLIKEWANIKQACVLTWISDNTFRQRMNYEQNIKNKENRPIYEEFKTRIEKAKIYHLMECKKAILKQGLTWKNRKAAAWRLEKKDEDFKDKKWDIVINNNIWFSSIKIVDATWWEATDSTTNEETAGTTEEL